MSASDDNSGDADTDDGGPGRREVAHRLFAAEFDDASLSYSESDEERAPNYVVTPTGARVNRLFAVGVLTAVEAVNEETLRARIADPTGAFVSYAGQYQPDEMAFLDRTTPPAFLALTGKARTFEPEDSDRVFTSVRPESINEVDADTRDRWVVETARATLDRVRVFRDALDTGLTGEDLRRHLESQGVPAALAEGIPLAMDHYGTTTAYLDAVRTLAVETLEVVADERDEASSLDLAPDEGGEADVGPLPAGDTDLSVDVEVSAETTDSGESLAETAATSPAESDEATTTDTDTETATEADDIVSGSDTGSASPSADSTGGASTGPAATTESDDSAETAATTANSTESTTTDAEASTTTGTGASDGPGDFDAEEETPAETGADDLGDFDTSGTSSDEASGSVDDSDVDSPEDLDDVLDDETREAVKSEHDVGFSTGNEVDDPGEAGIDVPDADELEEMAAEAEAESAGSADTTDAGASAETETAAGAAASERPSEDEAGAGGDTAAVEDETTDDAPTGVDTAADATAADATADADDVDLESAVLDAMEAEDDGDGAPQEDVVSAVVAEYGVSETAVEEAIQDALMSGLCYESSGGLKPI
jgi:RPA family protein